MTITSTAYRAPALTRGPATFATSLVRRLARLVDAMVAEREVQHHRRQPTAASDQMLKDIAVAHAEIERTVWFGWPY